MGILRKYPGIHNPDENGLEGSEERPKVEPAPIIIRLD